jgi:hypothetical protein
MWFRRARERKAAWARFSAVADQIGAREGRLLEESFFGSLVVSYGLALITIRPGSAHEVARVLLDAAVAAGYIWPPDPPCYSERPCVFSKPADLPLLRIDTFPAGSTIRGSGIKVPAGHTGVIVALG